MARKKIEIVAVADDMYPERDGSAGWQIYVDGELVVEHIRDLDIGNSALDDVWEAAGIIVAFDFD